MSRRLTRHRLDAEAARPVLAQILDIGDGQAPKTVIGWRDSDGCLRRLRADYPNGFRLEANLSRPRGGQQYLTSYKIVTRFRTSLAV